MYDARSKSYEATVGHYARPDNALYIAESGNRPVFAHYGVLGTLVQKVPLSNPLI
jgi:hypothetical protein